MNTDEVFDEIGERGYTLGSLFQTSYVAGSGTKTDAWSAHYHDKHGKWVKGFGRNARDSLLDALRQTETVNLDDLI